MTADLPVRAAAPVDYVRTCPNAPIGGVGFFVIPGTETCLQISGYVRTEYRSAENLEFEPDREQDDYEFFARGPIAFDARTSTEFGTLRSFDGGGGRAMARNSVESLVLSDLLQTRDAIPNIGIGAPLLSRW